MGPGVYEIIYGLQLASEVIAGLDGGREFGAVIDGVTNAPGSVHRFQNQVTPTPVGDPQILRVVETIAFMITTVNPSTQIQIRNLSVALASLIVFELGPAGGDLSAFITLKRVA